MYANQARRCPSGAKDLGMQKNEKHTAQIAAPSVSTQPPHHSTRRFREKKRKENELLMGPHLLCLGMMAVRL